MPPTTITQPAAGVRLDKWLWAVRLYKTRTLAAQACRSGHVMIVDAKAKPARLVHVGETILSQHGEITRTTKVLGLIERRVDAQTAKAFAEDLTPPSEYEKQRERILTPPPFRARGAGRPTKKERRDWEKLF